jgi:plasmid stabilization system protein ParE
MSRTLILRRSAKAEYDHEIAYYEKQRSGLGSEFSTVIDESFAEILNNPKRYPVVHRDVRECLVPRFPFAIYFRLRANRVIILAVHHTSRDPSSWQSRR